jgi:hypothetical protein
LVRASVHSQRREDQQADAHGQHAVLLDRCLAHQEGAAQRIGQRQRDLQRAPDDLDDLLADDHAAHRDEDLLQVQAVDRPHDQALEGQPTAPATAIATSMAQKIATRPASRPVGENRPCRPSPWWPRRRPAR